MSSKSLIIKTYEHNGLSVEVPFTQAAFFNATKVAQAFGKTPKDWLRTDETQEYILAIGRKCLLEQNQLVIVKNGAPDTGGGTWLHPKLGIAFARWCNVDFAVWCDEIIEGILKGEPSAKPKLTREERYQLGVYRDAVKTAKLIGFVGNMALLSADNYCKTTLGCSILDSMGATHLIADERGRTYTPTELGKMMAPFLSAIKLNLALEQAGLQKRDMGEWMPTDKAAGLCEWLDTGKRHSNGTPVKQVKWFKTVLNQIANGFLKEAA